MGVRNVGNLCHQVPFKTKRTDQKIFNKLYSYMAFMPECEKILHASNDQKYNAREYIKTVEK